MKHNTTLLLLEEGELIIRVFNDPQGYILTMKADGSPAAKGHKATPANILNAMRLCKVTSRTNMITKLPEYWLGGKENTERLAAVLGHDLVDMFLELVDVVRERLSRDLGIDADPVKVVRRMRLEAKRNKYHPIMERIYVTKWDENCRWDQFYETLTLADGQDKKLAHVYMRKQIIENIQAWEGNVKGTVKPVPYVLTLVSRAKGTGKSSWCVEHVPRLGDEPMVCRGSELDLSGSRQAKGDCLEEMARWASHELGEVGTSVKTFEAYNHMQNYLAQTEDQGRGGFKTDFRYRRVHTQTATENDTRFLREIDRRFRVVHVTACANAAYDELVGTTDAMSQEDLWQLYRQAYEEWLDGAPYELVDDEVQQHLEQSEDHHMMHPAIERLEELIEWGKEANGAAVQWASVREVMERLGASENTKWLVDEVRDTLDANFLYHKKKKFPTDDEGNKPKTRYRVWECKLGHDLATTTAQLALAVDNTKGSRGSTREQHFGKFDED